MTRKTFLFLAILLFSTSYACAQNQRWSKDGTFLYSVEKDKIVKTQFPANTKTDFLPLSKLTPQGALKSLSIQGFEFSTDETKMLIFTNSQRVWRYNTRGDYWVYDFKKDKLQQVGKSRPATTLMFAKLSPDGSKVAYTSERNVYVEDVESGKAKAMTTTNNTKKLINGTFDWVYEEEFDCRDGFRWSPDGNSIAYWQIDANKVKDFSMINTTDNIYPEIIPVEYPKVGESPSPCRIGVVNVKKGKTTWMNIEGDMQQNYLPRMEWTKKGDELIVQQLNRKQNHSKLLLCNPKSGASRLLWEDKDEAWIDAKDDKEDWNWLDGGQSFLWSSEKDGWRHIYKIGMDGKETLITKGNYDVISISGMDETNGLVYFMASPVNATQRYLYRVKVDGSSANPEMVSDATQQGTHSYVLSPTARFASHSFSSHEIPPLRESITLPENKTFGEGESIKARLDNIRPRKNAAEFFQVTTADGITMDGWMVKPSNFDSTKKYPIVFNVYTEPASTTVNDNMSAGSNRLYKGSMAEDGYVYMSLDGRGTPAPKGKAWRKAIYRKIGIVNIRDQAMGAQEVFKRWSWIDTSRVAVHGWSGGGSATLNLLFQYPDIYKTGIAVAAVANQLTYDNIYQERYMGIPQENKADFVAGSPITYAKNLRGNLLYIHGTGDDNVHYQNAEMLINELIKHNKVFQMMPYPNRSHGIYEGDGTSVHLQNLFTTYLKTHCPPGAR
jgi:dipeptidyl-peptidase 4